MADTKQITRDYSDNYAVKEFVKNGLIEKYFPDIDVSLRSIGMIGYTTELITNCTEDTFNAGSVLFRESFPNRAQLDESIYSHASIFQLSNVFSTAASCTFLLVLEEEAIIKNMIDNYDRDTGIYHFFIDKNTTIYVEDKPFTLDYDIKMDIVKKVNENGEDYLFTAKYIFDDYSNSISSLTDPYVKVRRSSDGFIALEVQTHQCTRDVRYETIITNSTINYPTIDIDFDGKLAGFDILYKAPEDENYTQMKTLVVYSQALKSPFCYYQEISEGIIRLTFNSKDTFFMPEFNSELKIILYVTNGEDGNFDVYNGTDITLIPDNEQYPYANTYLTAAKPIGASSGGMDQMDISSLQSLAVEGYRTANAITTQPDLQEYFNNYKYRYGDANILFIKKRDDIFERVYSSYIVIDYNDYRFNTNTLNLKINLADMSNPEKDVYTLEPGYLFTANTADGYANFYRDAEKTKSYYDDYQLAIANHEIDYIDDGTDKTLIPDYLKRNASFAEYKSRKNIDDKISVFDLSEDEIKKVDNPQNGSFLLMNPFLLRFTKSPNLLSTYMTYVSNTSIVDFTNQNDSSYLQFILYTIHVDRSFGKDKIYKISTIVSPSIAIGENDPLIKVIGKTDEGSNIYNINNKYDTKLNDLRLFIMIKDGTRNACYTELVPTEVNDDGTIKFECEMFTDDHITSDGKLRILTGMIYRNSETGEYYKVHTDDATLYDKYDKTDKIIEEDVPVDTVTDLYNNGILNIWYNSVNMMASHDILIPMYDVNVEIYTLYNHVYSADDGKLIPADDALTDNIFVDYDQTLKGYIWTNKYNTDSNPITFMKPLDNVRSYLTFEDFTASTTNSDTGEVVYKNDIMDATIYSIGMLRASTILNSERMTHFMNIFLQNYNFLDEIVKTRLRNATNLDLKFYNTYGKSLNFFIGENNEILSTINLYLEFDIWFIPGTDLLTVVPEVKRFIRSQVENINSNGMNYLYISNLMRKIELKFAYVDHIRFDKINHYNSTYQTVKNKVSDLDDLNVEDRRYYVPELLVCNEDDIIINEYYSS